MVLFFRLDLPFFLYNISYTIGARVLLVPYSAISRELLGAAKASLRLPFISSSGLQPPSSPIGSSLSLYLRLLPTIITISSSSIDSPYNLCSACLLPTVYLGNVPYNRYLHPSFSNRLPSPINPSGL